MAQFTSFQNILPDPNNPIGYAGQIGADVTAPDISRTGAGFASVELSSQEQILKNRTNSGRYVSRAASYQFWKINIKYNPLTRLEFMPVYTFLLEKRGGLKPFYVSLPQYTVPQDSTFDGSGYEDTLSPSITYLAGETSMTVDALSYNYITHGTPLPGDVFNINDSSNSNHKKVYMVTRVETAANYFGSPAPQSNELIVHFTPSLSKDVASTATLDFTNPLFKVVLSNDVQQYSLSTNNLYQYNLSLEEVQ
jgi:hypothetical protein